MECMRTEEALKNELARDWEEGRKEGKWERGGSEVEEVSFGSRSYLALSLSLLLEEDLPSAGESKSREAARREECIAGRL